MASSNVKIILCYKYTDELTTSEALNYPYRTFSVLHHGHTFNVVEKLLSLLQTYFLRIPVGLQIQKK